MKSIDAKQLWKKYQRGTCTDEEKAIMESWLTSYAKSNEGFPTKEEFLNAEKEIAKGLPIAYHESKPKTLSAWLIPIAVAASLLAAGSYIYFKIMKQDPLVPKVVMLNDISPGKNGATLTLADGRKIVLSEAMNGKLAEQAGLSITKQADGQLIYDIVSSTNNSIKNTNQQTYNTLSTAKGETYQVRLPDGTKVWLNAASSITYATSLNESEGIKERRIELSGEAYFEVAKLFSPPGSKQSKRVPFIVVMEQQTVEVLGTHFNINSYADENRVQTTLLEGSIRVHPNGASKGIILKPGQQAALTDHQITVSLADMESVMAWKNGLFVFNETDVPTLMRQISRWYNVEISYDSGIPKNLISGGIERNNSLSTVMKMLEMVNIKYRLVQEGQTRKIIIIP